MGDYLIWGFTAYKINANPSKGLQGGGEMSPGV
jgi:hypothetical protein